MNFNGKRFYEVIMDFDISPVAVVDPAHPAHLPLCHLRMTQFPSARHCAFWAPPAPGNHESTGKRESGTTRKGNQWLRVALLEATWAGSHTRTYLAAQVPPDRPPPGEEEGCRGPASSSGPTIS